MERPGIPLIGRRVRHLRRYREVAEVLARHGFAVFVASLGLHTLLPRRWRRAGEAGGPAHLRRALEELGPTFVKLGQVLSLRADLLPHEYVVELSRLQDRVPPQPFEVSRALIEQELGAPVSRFFRRIDPEPLASASLGQVYAAELPGGESVVVKVMRAGVEEQVQTDLEIIRDLARLAADRLGAVRVDPVALADEFARIMRRELDYRVEARQILRFRRNFRGDRRIHIPRVYLDRSTARVLTMERLTGAKVTDFARLEAMGVDRRRLARNGAEVFLKMVLVDRYFHADPHPGNLLVEADGRLGVLDFGMVASLSRETTEHLAGTFLSIVRQDARGAVRGMRRMGIVPPDVDLSSLERDIGDLISRNYGRPISELSLSEMVTDAMELVARHRLQLPAELLLLARALALLDGLARALDPSFNALEAALPIARRLALQRFDLRRQADLFLEGVQEVAEVVRTLPERVDRLLDMAEAGYFRAGQRGPLDAEWQLRRMERAANRVALSFLAAGLGIAGGLLWNAPAGPRIAGVPMFAAAAVAGSMAAAMALAWAIWRSGRL